MKRAIALLIVCLMTQNASALFDAQLLVGQSTLKVGDVEHTGTRTDVAGAI